MINTLTISGNLVAPAKITDFSNGGAVAEFTIGHNHRYTDDAGKLVETTSYFDIKAFGNQVNGIERLDKGSQVFIVGKLTQESWEDRTTRTMRYKVVIKAQIVQFGHRPNPTRHHEEDEAPRAQVRKPSKAAPRAQARQTPKAAPRTQRARSREVETSDHHVTDAGKRQHPNRREYQIRNVPARSRTAPIDNLDIDPSDLEETPF